MLLFFAGMANQMGRVMIPAIKTSVMTDPVFGPTFKANVGMMLSAVSIVCLGGKILGAGVTDWLGGWLMLIGVFAVWIVATVGAIATSSVDIFGGMWLLNSLAYTVTWGAQVQVIGATFSEAERPGQLSSAASSSRVGATFGNIVFGQLLSAGFSWRATLMPMVPVQVLLLLGCVYGWSKAPRSAAGEAKGAAKDEGSEGVPPLNAMRTPEFWLLMVPKACCFTATQFFMNYIPQLLHVRYGFSHGSAATLGGIAQGGSVVSLMFVSPLVYKKASKPAKVAMLAGMLAVSAAVPALLAVSASLPVDITPVVVPLCMLWGLAYVIPFYLPGGEYAMAVGGAKYTGMYTNIFDATGFLASAVWNPWASASSKGGDFETVLWSQVVFFAGSMVAMPLAMSRLNAKADAAKKKD